MISVRTSGVVQRAVQLIDPDEHDRAACTNAVRIASFEIAATDADLRRLFDRRSKQGRRAADRLYKAVERLHQALADPHLPETLWSIFPPASDIVDKDFLRGGIMRRSDETDRWIRLWGKRMDAARKPGRQLPFRPKAQRKLAAAREAHDLLKMFKRDISCSADSAFCLLAATLAGRPKENFSRPCWQVMRSLKK